MAVYLFLVTGWGCGLSEQWRKQHMASPMCFWYISSSSEGATDEFSATLQVKLQAYNMARIKLVSQTCKMQALARMFGNTEVLKDQILLSFLKCHD